MSCVRHAGFGVQFVSWPSMPGSRFLHGGHLPSTLSVQFDRIKRRWWLVAAIAFLGMVGAYVTAPSSETAYTGRSLVSTATMKRPPEQDSILAQGYAIYFGDPAFQQVFRDRTKVPDDIDSFTAEFVPGTPLIYIEATSTNRDSASKGAGTLAQAYVDEINSRLSANRDQTVAAMTASVRKAWGDKIAQNDPQADTALLNLQQTVNGLNSDQSNQLSLLQPASGVTTFTPSKKKSVASGLVGGFMLGCVVAMLMGAATRRLYTADDISEKTGLNLLETVPPPGKDEERQVRLRHLANIVSRTSGPHAVVAVAPASAGSAAGDIAVAIAEQRALQGVRTTLVRADLRPGNDSGPGVAEFLADPNADDVVYRSSESTDNLRIVEPGSSGDDPYALFDRTRFGALVEVVRGDADLVIIESAPLSDAAESQVTSDVADRTLLVIDQGHTQVDEVNGAVDALRQVGAEVLGTILVEAPLSPLSALARLRQSRTKATENAGDIDDHATLASAGDA